MADFSEDNSNYNIELQTEYDEELKEPEMYRVILHNDHYTTMEFVIEVLVKIFHKELMEATRIMLDVHNKGKGLVGVYTFDIATTKVDQVRQMAKAREFPLKCSIEKV